MADDIKVVADFSDLQLMRRELVGVSKDAKSSASVFEREFSRVERQLVKSAKEAQKYYDTTLKVNKISKSASASAKVLERELNRQEKEFRQNSAAAQDFYNKLLGVSSVTKDASASASIFDRELNKIEASTKRASAAQNTFANTSRKGMRRVEVIAQQTGYQLGDLAVQIQGGTNAAVAFGQQGSQLLGFFGPAGALAGAALAIGTAFVAPLMNARKEAEALREEFEELISNIERSNLLRGVGGDVALQISSTSRELIEVENRIAKIDAGVAARIKGREGSTYAQEIIDLRQRTNEQYQADIDRKNALILQLRLLDEQRKAQKALAGDQALEAENLKSNIQYEADQRAKAREAEAKAKAEARKAEEADAAALLKWQAKLEKDLFDENNKFEREQNRIRQKELDELNDKIESMAERLSIPFAAALGLIRQAKLEATVGLDAFGGAGSYKYSGPQTIKPPRTTKTPKTKTPAQQIEEFMAQLEQANAVQRERIFLGEESARVTELVNKYKEAGIPLDMKRIQNLAREEQKLKTLQSAHNSMTDALMSVVDGTKSVGDAFKSMLRTMVLNIYKEMVAKQAVSGFLSLFGFANGGVFSGGSQVNAFADGGVVGGPTYFPMSGGQTGLMGEAGPEAIMPLKRGANGKLGVQVQGSGETTVVNNFNISANGDESVKRIVQQQIPRITEATKAAVVDSKRRGGSYGGAFS